MLEMRARETGHGGFLKVMEPRMKNKGTGVTAAKSRIATMSQNSLVPLGTSDLDVLNSMNMSGYEKKK